MPILGGLENGQIYFNTAFIIVLVSLLLQGWTIKPVAKKLGLIIPPRIGAVDKVEVDLPGAANHELLSYRVIKDSPVLRGERIPRWATPSLVIRDGKSMRYQYAGRLREHDLVYLFIVPSYSRLLDRLFASRAPVDDDDAEFFGAFALSPARPAADLDAAYGPGLLNESEKGLTIAELMRQRLGGKADYADRVRLGSIILIVRDLDEHDHITSVGMKPTLGARVSQAAVIGRAFGATAGLERLHKLDPRDTASYQPYWAVRAFLLTEAGDDTAAADAYMTAIGLSDSPAVRDFLAGRLKEARQAISS